MCTAISSSLHGSSLWLAHKHNPVRCGAAWDAAHYPRVPDISIAFPKVASANVPADAYPKPAVPFEWAGPEGRKRKAVAHRFVTREGS